MTVNALLIRVKLLRAINRNPDTYTYSYSCLCERSLSGGDNNHNNKTTIIIILNLYLLRSFYNQTITIFVLLAAVSTGEFIQSSSYRLPGEFFSESLVFSFLGKQILCLLIVVHRELLERR